MNSNVQRALFVSIAFLVGAGCGGEDEDGGETAATGNALRGGQLYDAYWKVPGVMSAAEPTTNHPVWATRPDMVSNTRMGPDTWRCKECHGWDYKGVIGQYGSGSHATGFPGVLNTPLAAADIVAKLSDPAGHAYGALLSDADMTDVAAFIKTGLMDTSTIIDANGAFIGGDVAAGQLAYDQTCTVCHGADGLNPVPTGSAGGFEDFPGLIANDNPWEYVHKVRFGQPGTAMPPQDTILDPAGLSNLGAYTQTLPMAPTTTTQ